MRSTSCTAAPATPLASTFIIWSPTATTQPPVSPVPRDDELYEVINGKRVVLPPMGIFAAWIAGQLFEQLSHFARTKNLGRAVPEGLFHMPAPISRDRRPDVAFVSYQRWPKSRPLPPTDNAWDVVPDLAVEVVSPTDAAEDLQAKVEEYFNDHFGFRKRLIYGLSLAKVAVLGVSPSPKVIFGRNHWLYYGDVDIPY